MFNRGDRVVYISSNKSSPWNGGHGKIVEYYEDANKYVVEFDDRQVRFTISEYELFEEASKETESTLLIDETKLTI
jgi:hypothetical protein